MPDCRVEPAAPGDPKFSMLAELLEIDRTHAFGLAVSIWCLCWRKEYLDGRLKRWSPRALADEIYWRGDPKKMVDSMLTAEVLTQEGDGTLVAKNFSKRQGPLINKLLRERGASVPADEKPATKPGAAGDSSGVKLLLDRMRECHVTGGISQKREHAEAWVARGIAQKAEQLIMGEGKTKDIFWLSKSLNGGSTADATPSSIAEIKKKFGVKK